MYRYMWATPYPLLVLHYKPDPASCFFQKSCIFYSQWQQITRCRWRFKQTSCDKYPPIPTPAQSTHCQSFSFQPSERFYRLVWNQPLPNKSPILNYVCNKKNKQNTKHAL